MLVLLISRGRQPWLQLQASTCSQERWCCPGGLGWPSAFSHQWRISRYAGNPLTNAETWSTVRLNFYLCSVGCAGHLHPAALCPHSPRSHSPVWLRSSSVSGHLGSGRAPQNAQMITLCFLDKANPDTPGLKAVLGLFFFLF